MLLRSLLHPQNIGQHAKHWFGTGGRALIAGMLCLQLFGMGALVVGSLSGPTPSAQAIDKTKLKQKKASLDAQRKQAKIKKAENLKRAQYHEERLVNKQMELSQTQRKLATQEGILNNTSSTIEQLQKELDISIGETARLSKAIGARIRDWYKGGRVSLLEEVLSSDSVTKMMDTVHFQTKIIAQDRRLFIEIRKKQEELKAKQVLLLEERQEIAEAVAEIQDLKSTLDVQLEQEQKLRNKYKNDAAYYERLERGLLQESSKITNMLRGNYGDVRRSTGRFIWPVNGRVTSGFGYRVHPIHRTRTRHTGIDIPKPRGTTVMAADGGKVIFAGWRGGYGRCVIINHGKGLATLYAHMQSIYVSNGSYVGKGQSVGAVGTTGYSTGPHLHFEVRSNGSPVNPLGYL